MNNDCAKREIFTQITDLLTKLKMEYNAEFQVVLFTAIGKIECDVEPFVADGSPIGVTDDPTEFTLDISAVFSDADASCARLINVKNASVYPMDSRDAITCVEQMIVFADQILGFTLVRKEI